MIKEIYGGRGTKFREVKEEIGCEKMADQKIRRPEDQKTRMFLFEFNSAEWEEKQEFLFFDPSVRFKSLRADSEYYYALYDCGQFFAETRISKALKKMVDISGFYPDDERINLYIEFYNANKDKEDVL